MSDAELDKILACPNLPTLPAVAMEVLELTRDPDVSLKAIAKVVENDPALASKILRTVNSSFYGLSRPCPNISRALGYLGLSTVKSLVLGFSLVECTQTPDESAGFDLIEYWRRTLLSAVGARHLALEVKRCDPDEAFIAALLLDVGMLAMRTALGEEYEQVAVLAAGDHASLAEVEMEALGLTHMRVGAAMGRKWRLPPELIECMADHHSIRIGDDGGGASSQLLRVVVLGSLAALALGEAPDPTKLRTFTRSAAAWFRLGPEQASAVLKKIRQNATEVSRLFSVDIGHPPDLQGLLGQANEQLIQTQIEVAREATALRESNTELARQTLTDGLTGCANRKCFDKTLAHAFAEGNRSGRSVAVLFIDADRFKSVNDTHGHQAGDAVLVELARRLKQVADKVGTVCRYGGEEFAIVVPGADPSRGAKLAELIRRTMEATPFDLRAVDCDADQLTVTISIGVAATDPANPDRFPDPEDLVQAADRCVYDAKQAGRNRVRVHRNSAPVEATPTTTREAGPATPVLVIEDDPLAAQLLCNAMEAGRLMTPTVVTSGEEALEVVRAESSRYGLILCDPRLTKMSGIDLIRALRALPACRATPIIVLSAGEDPSEHDACLEAGANAFVLKGTFCREVGAWLQRVADVWLPVRQAAA